MGTNRINIKNGWPEKENRVQMTKLELHEDARGYYLSAKFKVEDKHSIREYDIPRIGLHINPNKVEVITECDPYSICDSAWIDLGFGRLPLEYEEINGRAIRFIETVLEEKYTEMTVADIEKKLGYKVKIVSD